MKLSTGWADSPGKGDGRWQQLNKTQVSVGIQYWMFFNSFLFNFFLILLFFLSCFSLGFSLFYSSFGLFFWGCVWCVGFPSAARNHLCYELWVSHHHASGFSFWFVLLLYMEVQITPGFLFSLMICLFFSRIVTATYMWCKGLEHLGFCLRGWQIFGWCQTDFVNSVVSEARGGKFLILHFCLQLPLFISDSPWV